MGLGDEIKRRRDELGWTQEKLAAEAGLKQPTLNRIEKGTRPRPRGSSVRAIAHALQTTVEDLYAGEPPITESGGPLEALRVLVGEVSGQQTRTIDLLEVLRGEIAAVRTDLGELSASRQSDWKVAHDLEAVVSDHRTRIVKLESARVARPKGRKGKG